MNGFVGLDCYSEGEETACVKTQLLGSSSSMYSGMAPCSQALTMNSFVGLADDFEGVETVSSSESNDIDRTDSSRGTLGIIFVITEC